MWATRLWWVSSTTTAVALTAVPALAQPAEALPERWASLQTTAQTHASYKVRATAVVALGRTPAVHRVQVLSAIEDRLQHDAHYAVRAAAASALGALQEPGGVMPLMRALDDSEALVRRHAQRALLKFHQPKHLLAFRDLLNDAHTQRRLQAHDAYRAVFLQGESSAGFAILMGLDDDGEAIPRKHREALRTAPMELVGDVLQRGVRAGSAQVRTTCYEVLAERPDAQFAGALVEQLFDGSELGDARAALHKALRAHQAHLPVDKWRADSVADDKAAQKDGLMGLAVLQDPSLAAAAKKAIVSGDPAVRTAAARALATAADDASMRLLKGAHRRESDARTKRQMERLLRTAKR